MEKGTEAVIGASRVGSYNISVFRYYYYSQSEGAVIFTVSSCRSICVDKMLQLTLPYMGVLSEVIIRWL